MILLYFIFLIVSCELVIGGDIQQCSCNENPCGRNATYKSCPNPCPGTCSNPVGVPNCMRLCKEYGCECNPGYVSSDDGRCILPKDCPDYLRCNGDRNATYTTCPNPCQPTCSSPNGIKPCTRACLREGCQCKDGFYLNDYGDCVSWQNCPDYLRCGGDRNAVYKACPNPCPKTCKFPGGRGPCNKMCVAHGCECKKGYYKDKYGKCVLLRNCPRAKRCGPNENFIFCKGECPTNFCPEDDNLNTVACSPPSPCASGCGCKQNFLRLSREDDRCIPAYKCPPVRCTRPNEVWNSCPRPGFKEKCSDLATPSPDQRFFSCRPRCVCRDGFLRNDLGVCVHKQKCNRRDEQYDKPTPDGNTSAYNGTTNY